MSNASGISQDRNPVEALADDFLRRQRGGERPTLEDYCRRHPELADEIREVFPVLIRMEDLRSDGPDDSTGERRRPHRDAAGAAGRLPHPPRGRPRAAWASSTRPSRSRSAVAWPSRSCPMRPYPTPSRCCGSSGRRGPRRGCTTPTSSRSSAWARDDGHHYYVMQFIPGMGLDAVLEELRRLRRVGGSASAARGRDPIRRGGQRGGGGRGDPHRAVLAHGSGHRRAGPERGDGHRRRHDRSSTRSRHPPPPRRRSASRRLGRLAGPLRPRPHLLPQRGPHRAPGRRGAGVRQPPGRPPPRRQAVQPAAGPQGQRLGGRLRAWPRPPTPRTSPTRATSSARCGTWPRSGSRANATPARTSTRWA